MGGGGLSVYRWGKQQAFHMEKSVRILLEHWEQGQAGDRGIGNAAKALCTLKISLEGLSPLYLTPGEQKLSHSLPALEAGGMLRSGQVLAHPGSRPLPLVFPSYTCWNISLLFLALCWGAMSIWKGSETYIIWTVMHPSRVAGQEKAPEVPFLSYGPPLQESQAITNSPSLGTRHNLYKWISMSHSPMWLLSLSHIFCLWLCLSLCAIMRSFFISWSYDLLLRHHTPTE